jgi:hypothetical protein
MKKLELSNKLSLLGIDKAQYSLDGELKPDSIILFRNYSRWEVFYLDERGGRNNERIFTTESEACCYIYGLFSDAKQTELFYKSLPFA